MITPKQFEDTRWSQVVEARTDSEAGRAALGELCKNYWYPLYAFLRQRGRGKQDAEDLVQEFFTRLMDGRLLAAADPTAGRFRSFLLAALKNLDLDALKASQRQKRGGAREIFSLQAENAEERWMEDRSHVNSPEAAFDRAWAVLLLERAGTELCGEFERAKKLPLFEALWPRITGAGGMDNAGIGDQLGMSPGAVSVALGRLRTRYADAMRREVAKAVGEGGNLEEEIRQLLEVFSE